MSIKERIKHIAFPIIEKAEKDGINLTAPELADLTLNNVNYAKVMEDALVEIKKTVADALLVFESCLDFSSIQGIVPIEPSERSESTFESSQVGSLCFGDDLGIEDANEIARNISPGNSIEIRWAAFKVSWIF